MADGIFRPTRRSTIQGLSAILLPLGGAKAAAAESESMNGARNTADAVFNLGTATIDEINRAMDQGALTAEKLVRLSLARVKAYEPDLHAVITLNPKAINEARALDEERRTKGRRSPLHGIPVLLKDNINTRDLPTTL